MHMALAHPQTVSSKHTEHSSPYGQCKSAQEQKENSQAHKNKNK
jgi:hypothetical protein